MQDIKNQSYNVFEMFDKQWALVTAGTPDHYNSCVLSWGSIGNMWGSPGKGRPTVTIYVHPARYTSEFLLESDTFTLSFYPDTCRKALGYMGSHSGREGDKAVSAGLTPKQMGDGMTYEEANLTFLCKKLYQHQFTKEDIAEEIQDYYASLPKTYPDFNGGWQPHILFIGEIIDVEDNR